MNKTEQPIKSPEQLASELAPNADIVEHINRNRAELRKIFDRTDKRLVVIAGPCSIHNVPAALEYAEKLAKLSERVSDDIKLVMRCYFEKPRTTLGWKGLVYDPDLDGGSDIARGLELARKLLIDVSALGLGTVMMMELRELYEIGTELLSADPYLLLSDDPANVSCARIRKEHERRTQYRKQHN